MKKYILMSDSFKGTMTSIQVSTIMKEVYWITGDGQIESAGDKVTEQNANSLYI